jgi:hypothetical protein
MGFINFYYPNNLHTAYHCLNSTCFDERRVVKLKSRREVCHALISWPGIAEYGETIKGTRHFFGNHFCSDGALRDEVGYYKLQVVTLLLYQVIIGVLLQLRDALYEHPAVAES